MPIAFCLSGGIDSASLVSICYKYFNIKASFFLRKFITSNDNNIPVSPNKMKQCELIIEKTDDNLKKQYL